MDDTDVRNSLSALHSASFAWAMTCCHDRELAEEVLQSVYVKVLDGHADYQGRSSFQTWLFAIIRNAARDRQRKRWWSQVLRLDSRAEAPEPASVGCSEIQDEDDVLQIRAALRELPKRQGEVAHLVFYEDLTVAEAAEVMGVAVGTVRQHYARAKESLRLSLRPLWNRTNE